MKQVNSKLGSIEGVRGLACFMVLLSHLSSIFFPYLHGQKPELIKSSFDAVLFEFPIAFIYSGTGAVYIFFCLSGYILTYACVNKGDIYSNAAKMLCARYLRLAIPTSVAIMICFVVLSVFHGRADSLPWISGWGAGVDINFFSAIYNAAFSSVALGDASYNWVVWTMQLELFGSFMVFFSVGVVSSIRFKAATYILLALIIAVNFPGKVGFGYASFMIGAAIYYTPRIKFRVSSILLLLSGLYLCGYHYRQHFYSYLSSFETGYLRSIGVSGSFLYLMLSGCIIVYVSVKSDILLPLICNRVSIWLGKMSFSAYLIQMPIFFLLAPFALDLQRVFNVGYTMSALITSAVCLSSIYLSSIVFQKYVDAKSVSVSKSMIKLLMSDIATLKEMSNNNERIV